MPEVTINLAEGRTAEQKTAVMRDVSDSIVKHLGVKAEDVVIQINEAPLANKMKGGKTFIERKAEQAK